MQICRSGIQMQVLTQVHTDTDGHGRTEIEVDGTDALETRMWNHRHGCRRTVADGHIVMHRHG